MAFLTDQYIANALGGPVNGAQKYNGAAPTPEVKAQYIAMADMAIVAAAIKGGYTTVSEYDTPTAGPIPAAGTSGFVLLQLMAFKIWLRIAYGYGREKIVGSEIDAQIPNASTLYANVDEGRLDIPGMSRSSLAGDGISLQNGTQSDGQPFVPIFTRESLRGFF